MNDSKTSKRFTTIDGLRGVASFMVVLFHFSGHQAFLPIVASVPSWLIAPLRVGSTGVAIFFVISGFVIAHSIGQAKVTAGYALNFGLRRSIRLDPPYWTTIAVVLTLSYLKGRFTDFEHTWPNCWSLFTHATYTFEVFGVPTLLPVFWTLCHEVQFYITYCLLLSVAPRGPMLLGVVFASGVISSLGIMQVQGLCLGTWYMFALGVLLYHAYSDPRPFTRWLCCFYLVFIAITTPWQFSNYRIAALATGVFVGIAGLSGRLESWLSAYILQYLGRISYSLYLLHGVVGWTTLSLANDFVGIRGPWQSLAWFGIGVIISLIAAHAMYWFVERPSVSLAKRLKRQLPIVDQREE